MKRGEWKITCFSIDSGVWFYFRPVFLLLRAECFFEDFGRRRRFDGALEVVEAPVDDSSVVVSTIALGLEKMSNYSKKV